MTLGVDEPIALGPFRVSLATTRVLRDGVELELRPRAFRALKVLIQNPGRLVDYEQMIREAWDGIQVSQSYRRGHHGRDQARAGRVRRLDQLPAQVRLPPGNTSIRGSHPARLAFLESMHAGRISKTPCAAFKRPRTADGADFRAFEGISSTYLMLAGFLMRAPRDIHRPFLEALDRAVALCGLTPELRLDRAFALFVFERKSLRLSPSFLQSNLSGQSLRNSTSAWP